MIRQKFYLLHVFNLFDCFKQPHKMFSAVCKSWNCHMANPERYVKFLYRLEKTKAFIHGLAGNIQISFPGVVLNVKQHQIRVFQDIPITAVSITGCIQAGVDALFFTQSQSLG